MAAPTTTADGTSSRGAPVTTARKANDRTPTLIVRPGARSNRLARLAVSADQRGVGQEHQQRVMAERRDRDGGDCRTGGELQPAGGELAVLDEHADVAAQAARRRPPRCRR